MVLVELLSLGQSRPRDLPPTESKLPWEVRKRGHGVDISRLFFVPCTW